MFSKVTRIWVVVLVLSAFTLFASCGPKSRADVAFGTIAAPEMTLLYLDGSKTKLSALEGKVVLLNFWATWCPPCRQELPHFEALHEDYADRGLAVVGVSMDQADRDYVSKFSEEVGITYQIAMSPFEDVEEIWSKIELIPTIYGFGSEEPEPSNGSVQMMPTTFLIDRSGRIFSKHVGPRDRETLEPDLRVLMGLEAPLAKAS